MTDFQRLRRNVLREIHDYSAPHRMLFSYEKKWSSARLRYGGPGVPPRSFLACAFRATPLRKLSTLQTYRKGPGEKPQLSICWRIRSRDNVAKRFTRCWTNSPTATSTETLFEEQTLDRLHQDDRAALDSKVQFQGAL